MLLADNGSNWYVSGAADRRWNDQDIEQLKRVPAAAFEVVKTGPLTPLTAQRFASAGCGFPA